MFTFAVKSRRNDSMNQDSDIRQFFQTGDFETFCKTIRNMAFNDSELCFDLLWELQRYPVYRHDRHVWDSVAPVRYAGLTRAQQSAYEEEELITMFLARCGEGKEVVDVLREKDAEFDLARVREFKYRFMSGCDGHATARVLKLMEKCMK